MMQLADCNSNLTNVLKRAAEAMCDPDTERELPQTLCLLCKCELGSIDEWHHCMAMIKSS